VAHFCYASVTDPISSVRCGLPDILQLGLWGGGPTGEDLNIVVAGPPIVEVRFPLELTSFPVPQLQVFELIAVGGGRTSIEGRVRSTGVPYTGPLDVMVGALDFNPDILGLSKYYHGTSLSAAKQLMTMNIEPQSVPEAKLLDWYEYTDFGKGFYVHPEESKKKAVEWAKRNSAEWGVVRFILAPDEKVSSPTPLYFSDKFKTRPANSPILFGNEHATWIEFVEFNRHIRKPPTISRPKDNDWTADYAWMEGPIWGRRDSNLPGPPGLPELYHQINFGLGGLTGFNAPAARRRRFLFTKHNEDLL
jgi:hypothetical protein